jgi:hypothetical protein
MVNEKRLIWDEDAKRHIIALAVGHHTDTLPVDMVVNAILHHAPTVDAVEVVRCKYCKHQGHCEIEELVIHGVNGDNPYCSYGERKRQ